MVHFHLFIGSAVLLLNLAAGLFGIACWARNSAPRGFWILVRAGQAALVIQILLGMMLLLAGHKPADDLHLLYGLLPLGVTFVAEQLRVHAAQHILAARGLENAREVGALAEAEQTMLVVAIMRREVAVMALAAVMIAVLALRAAMTSGAL